MGNYKDYDFCGWASKNDLKCADGRIIRRGAFKVNDGKKVPLVWNHQHNSPSDVLGHAYLENRDEGVYAYGYFNNTSNGKDAKEQLNHGDVEALSIWANNLQEVGSEVFHGVIREVSLVLAGANPGAFVESVMAHGEPMDVGEEEGIFYTDDTLEFISHAEPNPDKEEKKEDKKDMADNKMDQSTSSDKTVGEVIETMNDEQKAAMAIVVGQAIQDSQGGDEEEDGEMKHNIFDADEPQVNVLSHSDMQKILRDAKTCGSLKEAVNANIEEGGVLAHAIDTTGMTTATGDSTYGFNDPDMFFPDYKAMQSTPEWISRNMDWVQKVIGAVHHTPFSRIKSMYANITEDEARAKGYIKGNQKKTEVFTTLKRSTDPQTVYKLQKMDRDDILDITDFDVVAWIRAEMRTMLNEEIARAILIGDGRQDDAEDKIQEAHIRPIVKDVPLFNTKVKVNVSQNATSNEVAKEMINSIIRARKDYKGSGNPSFYTTEDTLTEMLLLEDGIGHKLYKTESELATALRVKDIITVEPMEGLQIDNLPLCGVIVNLSDYNVGMDKGGEISMFDDFDIDFNRYSYLIETRMSGALIKPYSALTILLNKQSAAG